MYSHLAFLPIDAGNDLVERLKIDRRFLFVEFVGTLNKSNINCLLEPKHN